MIVAHAGAGIHDLSKKKIYMRDLKNVIEAATDAPNCVTKLENLEWTNAGWTDENSTSGAGVYRLIDGKSVFAGVNNEKF